MAHYLLVHGAWHGAWCWSKVVPLMEGAGHTVEVLDLPGLGDDPTPPETTSLASYAERIVKSLDAAEGQTVLVGHSMGGMAISQAAEARPNKIHTLVYVAAFLPRDGDSLLSLASTDKEALVLRNVIIDEARQLASLPPEQRREIFYNSCTEEDSAAAAARLVPQFMGILGAPARLTAERHGGVKRVYIECTLDKAIGIATQRSMVAASPCAAVHTLETDHSPFLSQPGALASLLCGAAGQDGAAS